MNPSTPLPHYRSIWLSDLHLGSRGCRAQELKDFLKNISFDRLYLVGDIVDFWSLQRRYYWPRSHSDILHHIFDMAQEGREIIYIPGNHDDPLRRYCGHSFCGIEIHANAIHVTANQKKLLVLHGDEFDSAIKCHGLLSFVGHYAYSFILSLNRFTNYLRNKAGLGYWSLASHLKARSKKAVTYIERFERAASTAAKRENVDGIICGHIHRPKLEYMDGVLYCNDGDWVENCSYLVEHRDGTLEILRWHERSMPERVTPRPLAA